MTFGSGFSLPLFNLISFISTEFGPSPNYQLTALLSGECQKPRLAEANGHHVCPSFWWCFCPSVLCYSLLKGYWCQQNDRPNRCTERMFSNSLLLDYETQTVDLTSSRKNPFPFFFLLSLHFIIHLLFSLPDWWTTRRSCEVALKQVPGVLLWDTWDVSILCLTCC